LPAHLVFNKLQSAYRKHHSTETSLIHLLDSIYYAAANGLTTFLLSLVVVCSFNILHYGSVSVRLFEILRFWFSALSVIDSAYNEGLMF